MDRFPAEILELIGQQCDHRRLKSLRLANRALHRATTACLFESFNMALFDESLDKLVSLARSSLAKHVKCLNFFIDVLPDWDRARWEVAINALSSLEWNDRCLPYRLPYNGFECLLLYKRIHDMRRVNKVDIYSIARGHDFTRCELDAAHKEFHRLRQSQRNWRIDQQGLLLKEMLVMLPELMEVRTMYFVPVQERLGDLWDRSTLLWDFPDPEMTRVSGEASLYLLDGIGFRACFAGMKHISKLSLHAVHWEPFKEWIRKASLRSSDPSLMQQQSKFNSVKEGFRTLTEVRARIPIYSFPGGTDGFEELLMLLAEAQQLRALTLECEDHKNESTPVKTLTHRVIADLVRVPRLWPLIHHLSISIKIPDEALLSLLKVLSNSLRSLELRNVTPEGVPRLVGEIPQILDLEHICVKSI